MTVAGVDAESARLLLAEAQLLRERGNYDLARDLVAAADVHARLAVLPVTRTATGSTPEPTSVRSAVLDVIHPGEEVSVTDVAHRCARRGHHPSASVVSNDLAHWTRAGELTRVARGRYRR